MKKDTIIKFRVTKPEKDFLKELAKKNKENISKLLRKRLFNKKK